jgi:hydroxymethylbilane synthase
MKAHFLKIGTRGSQLALIQARWVQARLRDLGQESELVIIHTAGDKLTRAPLTQIGGQGVFVKELEDALLAKEIDLAVHSLKDVATTLAEGLTLAAMPQREDPRDVLCSRLGETLDDLPGRARVATSSMRRRAQILATRPDLHCVEVRGNVDTRLRKLAEGEFDAIVMAAAGLVRMDMTRQISQYLPFEISMPAPGQGALAIEARRTDRKLRTLLLQLDDAEIRAAVEAERAFLAALGGGCILPVGAIGIVEGETLILRGMVASADGKRVLREKVCGPAAESVYLGQELAEKLRAQGAEEILAALPVPEQMKGESQ